MAAWVSTGLSNNTQEHLHLPPLRPQNQGVRKPKHVKIWVVLQQLGHFRTFYQFAQAAFCKTCFLDIEVWDFSTASNKNKRIKRTWWIVSLVVVNWHKLRLEHQH